MVSKNLGVNYWTRDFTTEFTTGLKREGDVLRSNVTTREFSTEFTTGLKKREVDVLRSNVSGLGGFEESLLSRLEIILLTPDCVCVCVCV